MNRAVVVYLDYTRGLLQQFACLYRSYQYIGANKDTDLVVFGPKKSLELVPDDCIKIELEPLEGIWKTYRFMNSIYCVASKEADFLTSYDYILRTDVDTFLTPSWNDYIPAYYTVGRGAYANSDLVRTNLKQISQRFNLRHQGIHNIGSTHYGNASLVREVCKLSVDIAKYLLEEEFSENEGQWPGWFRGVSSMYSTEIAVNHLVDMIDIKPEMLDYDSTSINSISLHPHIHCWHTNNLFSKFKYGDGEYDQLQPNLASNEVRHYCLKMGLDAKRMFPNLFV
ncbi:DUF7164 domain-containing protein [Rossellomorea aquimaris]|uniref:DUF7164 domain-containing protein n=1 Tax=Rossellomorea aquimaris TaxID=189382 RepID=UPI0007D07FFA|nr:hypothetical protein [Rossellomorea aquimaris]